MVTKARVALCTVALSTLLAACGSSDVKADKFADALAEKTKLTKAEATCVTDKVYDEFDQSEINELYTANDVADVADGNADRFEEIVKGCAKG